MPHPRNDIIHLVPRQLAAFARLGPLCHLDLEFIGIDEIVRRHPESSRCHLLDGTAPRIAVGVGDEASFVFPALAGVGSAADPVHGDGQRLMRFFGYRPE
jgi:hypothetical protein